MTLNESSSEKFSRLPTDVIPINYSITLQSNFETFKFTGNEVINVKVINETSKVVINSADIVINSVSFKCNDGKEMKAASFELNEKKELLTMNFERTLPLGDGELIIDFVGTHADNMKGFYRSKNQTPDGKEEYSVITQFEPIDARRAFPCWDEPAHKATFVITLIVPKHLTAISNMNAISEGIYEKDDKYKIVKFAPTPLMSTYLVAAAVGNYDYVETNTPSGVNVRVYTRKTKSEQGRLGLEFSVRVLEFYKQVFGIDYPLPKMDLLAAPDFCMGAMENWGLITYREACILYDCVECSSAVKQRILVVIAHEIAHQWFGNLVTMEWWTYLWLNEGFARFMEFYCLNALCPEMQIWSTFISDTLIRALHLDGLHSSHPIEVPIDNPDDIDQIFDAISYEKGASVIRMLYRFIGDEHFRNGLKKYLSHFSYKNTVTEDLWEAFEDVSKKPVKKIMDSWVKQKGYPVVIVDEAQVGNDRVLTLKQEKFCSNGKPCDGDANVIWPIPIEVIKQSNPNEIVAEMVFDTKSTTLTVKNVKPDEWVKLNPNTTGVYRCQYSHAMLSKFYSPIESKELPSADRFGILNDVFAMVQSGRASTVELLKLMKCYVNEDDYTVWSSVCTCFGSLNALLARNDFHEKFLEFGRELFSKISAKLGYDAKPDDDHLTALLRTMILGMLASVGNEMFIKDAKERFEKHCSGKETVPADMRGAVYHVIAANGDDNAFDMLFELHRKADLVTEKTRILYSLGATKDDARIQKILQFTLSGEVRDQDMFQGFMGLTSNHKGIEQSWQLYKKEFDSLNKRLTNPSLRAHLIKSCTTGFVSEEKANEVEAFFNENKMPTAERAIEQSIEAIRLKAEWLKRDLAAIKAYLTE